MKKKNRINSNENISDEKFGHYYKTPAIITTPVTKVTTLLLLLLLLYKKQLQKILKTR